MRKRLSVNHCPCNNMHRVSCDRPLFYPPPPPPFSVAEFDHLTRHPVRVEQDGVEVSMNLVDTCGLVSN